MTLVRQWGRPTRPTLALIGVGVVCLIAGLLVIHGTPPRYVTRGHARIPGDQNGTRDYLRSILDIGGVVLVLYGLYRWST